MLYNEAYRLLNYNKSKENIIKNKGFLLLWSGARTLLYKSDLYFYIIIQFFEKLRFQNNFLNL